VRFDGKWIRHVLLNLITNSVTASQAGGVITIRSDLDAAKWVMSVEDEGIGVPEDQRDRIFDRFVRLGKSDGALDKGTGLGLALCRSIVELHGGSIYAGAGGGGLGLRVVIELPRFEAGEGAAAEAGSSPDAVPTMDTHPSKRSGREELKPA
jgi:two-component system heavy metal sensor histidine kinase CusS